MLNGLRRGGPVQSTYPEVRTLKRKTHVSGTTTKPGIALNGPKHHLIWPRPLKMVQEGSLYLNIIKTSKSNVDSFGHDSHLMAKLSSM